MGVQMDSAHFADRSKLEPRTRRHADIGARLMKAGYPKEAGRIAWQKRAESFFGDHDVLVTPGLAQSPISAQRWSEKGWLANLLADARYAPFGAPWNLAAFPAMAVPAGEGRDGLPRSVQLVARPGGEALLLSVSAQLELLRPWRRLAPASYRWLTRASSRSDGGRLVPRRPCHLGLRLVRRENRHRTLRSSPVALFRCCDDNGRS